MSLSVQGDVIQASGAEADRIRAAEEVPKRRRAWIVVGILRRLAAADHDDEALTAGDELIHAGEEIWISLRAHAGGEISWAVIKARTLGIPVIAQAFIGALGKGRVGREGLISNARDRGGVEIAVKGTEDGSGYPVAGIREHDSHALVRGAHVLQQTQTLRLAVLGGLGGEIYLNWVLTRSAKRIGRRVVVDIEGAFP